MRISFISFNAVTSEEEEKEELLGLREKKKKAFICSHWALQSLQFGRKWSFILTSR